MAFSGPGQAYSRYSRCTGSKYVVFGFGQYFPPVKSKSPELNVARKALFLKHDPAVTRRRPVSGSSVLPGPAALWQFQVEVNGMRIRLRKMRRPRRRQNRGTNPRLRKTVNRSIDHSPNKNLQVTQSPRLRMALFLTCSCDTSQSRCANEIATP